MGVVPDAVTALSGEPAKPADDEGEKSARPLTKGFLAFTGSGAKSAAQQAATKMLGGHEAKGLITTGQVPFGVPLVSRSPLERDRVPTSLLDVLPVVTRDVPV